jgi:membrane-associated PAP2 superfamily phosphatase
MSGTAGAADRPAPTKGARPGQALVMTATVTMGLIALQFVLAGYGIFERQYHQADDGWFEPHKAVGYVTILATIAVLVVAVMTRRGRSVVARAGVVVVLAVLQPLFAGLGTDTNPWWGVVHALDAVLVAGITGSLIGSGVRANAQP